MERVFAEKHLAPATPIEMSSTEAIKQGVEAGLGLALLSAHTLEMELSLRRLVVLDVEGFPVLREWYIVHRAGKRLSAPALAFRDFILSETRRSSMCRRCEAAESVRPAGARERPSCAHRAVSGHG